MSRTLLIIKPDASKRNLTEYIISRLEKARFKIVKMKKLKLKKSQAREFYAVHEGKHFLDSLVKFMCSGTIVPMALEKENAVKDLRALIGATDPSKADCGTIRFEIAKDIEKNSVHASDSDANAKKEIDFFFNK
ncbi:MAG: nucleoside-diphosphate kinase [candidate division Zixibacteria bacterium]|nr:nucleoside-diphosphate kinase [candidate division Zixibacteria bacterium]